MSPEHTDRTSKIVGTSWGLLVLNTLGSAGAKTIVPLPRSLIQMVTMGALVAAFTLALTVNTRLRIRASAFVFLLTLLLVPSVISSADLESGFGAVFRCARLALFVGTLWLLSRWWDGGLTFVRLHIRMYFVVLGSVAMRRCHLTGRRPARAVRRAAGRRVVAAHPAADRAVRRGHHRACRAAPAGPPDRLAQRGGGHRAGDSSCSR